jgi:hypothetical protein
VSKTITDYSTVASVDAAADYFLLYQASSGTYKRANRNAIIGVSGTPADLSTAQTFTNKVLGNTNTVTLKDNLFTLQDDGDTTKQAQFQLSGITTGTTRTYTLPNASSTLVDLSTSQTLTNKSLTSPVISGGSIDNSTITVDAIAEHTAATGVTVDGVKLKDGTIQTNSAVPTAAIADGAVTPAKLQSGTGTGWSWSTWSPTWTNVTIGNGVVTAKYIQMGKTVFGRVHIVFGTTTAVSGEFQFSLPVTAVALPGTAAVDPIGMGNMYDATTNVYKGIVNLTSTTAACLRPILTSGTTANNSLTTNLVPGTWAVSWEVGLNFCYEAA